MTAITAAKTRIQRNVEGKCQADLAITTAVQVFPGYLLNYVLTTGRVRAATAATSRKFAGLCESTSTTTGTGSTGGTQTAHVVWGIEVKLPCATALSVAYLGANAAILDNDGVTTASAAGTAGVQVLAGEVTEKASTNFAWVALRRFSKANV